MENQLVSGLCPCLCIPSTVQLKFNSNLIKHCFMHRLSPPSKLPFVCLSAHFEGIWCQLASCLADLFLREDWSYCFLPVVEVEGSVLEEGRGHCWPGERMKFGHFCSSFRKCFYDLIQRLRPGDLNVLFCTNTLKCIKTCT